jgi:predicted ATP-grasp superfamily ATP-dependent carboligase
VDFGLNVLVTDGNYKHTLGIVRDLGQKNVKVTVLVNSRSDLASYSRYCYRAEIAPRPTESGFVDAVLGVLGQNPYDLLIPVGYAAAESFARRRDEILALTSLQIPDHDLLKSAADKRYVCGLALRLGLPVPQTFYPDTWRAVARAHELLRFPVVIKSTLESSKTTVRYVQSAEKLLSTYREVCGQNDFAEGNLPMLQEYIPGYGCGFFALYQHGVCKRIFMHRRIRENPPSGGASTCAESFYDDKLKSYGIRLLDHLRWHGVAMVEFRYDIRDRDYKVLEVNPKFWGSLDLALEAKAEFPHDLCRMAQGAQLDYSEEYDRNLRYHWPLSGEIHHLARRPRALVGILSDCLNPSVKSNIWLSDLRPNLREANALMRAGFRTVLKG